MRKGAGEKEFSVVPFCSAAQPPARAGASAKPIGHLAVLGSVGRPEAARLGWVLVPGLGVDKLWLGRFLLASKDNVGRWGGMVTWRLAHWLGGASRFAGKLLWFVEFGKFVRRALSSRSPGARCGMGGRPRWCWLH